MCAMHFIHFLSASPCTTWIPLSQKCFAVVAAVNEYVLCATYDMPIPANSIPNNLSETNFFFIHSCCFVILLLYKLFNANQLKKNVAIVAFNDKNVDNDGVNLMTHYSACIQIIFIHSLSINIYTPIHLTMFH